MFRIISIKAKSGIPFLCFCFYITGKFIIYIQFIPEFIGFMIDERMESAIKQTGARVLILDPIQAYLGGTMDMNRANEARDRRTEIQYAGIYAETGIFCDRCAGYFRSIFEKTVAAD